MADWPAFTVEFRAADPTSAGVEPGVTQPRPRPCRRRAAATRCARRTSRWLGRPPLAAPAAYQPLSGGIGEAANDLLRRALRERGAFPSAAGLQRRVARRCGRRQRRSPGGAGPPGDRRGTAADARAGDDDPADAAAGHPLPAGAVVARRRGRDAAARTGVWRWETLFAHGRRKAAWSGHADPLGGPDCRGHTDSRRPNSPPRARLRRLVPTPAPTAAPLPTPTPSATPLPTLTP